MRTPRLDRLAVAVRDGKAPQLELMRAVLEATLVVPVVGEPGAEVPATVARDGQPFTLVFSGLDQAHANLPEGATGVVEAPGVDLVTFLPQGLGLLVATPEVVFDLKPEMVASLRADMAPGGPLAPEA